MKSVRLFAFRAKPILAHTYIILEVVIRLGSKESKDIFSADTLLPSSEGIISEVGDNPNAIGYDGLVNDPACQSGGVATKEGGEYILPSAETVNSGTYPISRDLYMYTNKTVRLQTYSRLGLSPRRPRNCDHAGVCACLYYGISHTPGLRQSDRPLDGHWPYRIANRTSLGSFLVANFVCNRKQSQRSAAK